MSEIREESKNFIEVIIDEDIAAGKHGGRIHTRFPPEPNGYLHIGHATAICLNFSIAKKYGGKTNLRFDDTNPVTEDTEYVDAIKKDVQWLGFQWEGSELYASDYFDTLYGYAVTLINKGLAYVDDSTADEIAEQKGTPTQPGKESPYRNRSIEENLRLFEGMKAGEFEDGAKVLRAKVDMTSPNMHMRDPVIYRIKRAHHHRTGDQWCIYPMYDFAHGQSDSIEGITHSLCSLEFRHHRPLYNWFIEHLEIFPSRQIEFARRNVSYMITSKRKLMKLVQEGLVRSWDDPRMPTISGMRRRGYPAAAIRNFCDRVGMAKRDNVIEVELLEACVREELNATTDRMMAVLDPIKLVITNYPDGKTEQLIAINNPALENPTTREIPFSKSLYIERADFMEDAPKKFFRLSQGRNVRLKYAYIIHCDGVLKDENGEIVEVQCSYYENSRSGSDESGIKAKGTLHWVSAEHAIDGQVNVYERLFTDPEPTGHEDKDFIEFYNQDSLKINKNAKLEPALAQVAAKTAFQFMRLGYFYSDDEHTPSAPIFNKTVGLKGAWKPKKK